MTLVAFAACGFAGVRAPAKPQAAPPVRSASEPARKRSRRVIPSQAAVGWHFHALHGINAELGIFPSYIGLESYLPQENWNYTHAFISDATPYYFVGLRTQLYLTRRLKLELWLVNGWQTFGQWHEGRAGGDLRRGEGLPRRVPGAAPAVGAGVAGRGDRHQRAA